MLSEELLQQVKALSEDDKLALFRMLAYDPAVGEHAYDPLGLRSNFEAARVLQDLLAEEKASQKSI